MTLDRQQYTREVCRIGQGAECCRYLTASGAGWHCEKGGPLAWTIDNKVERGEFTARGDNCAGQFGVVLPPDAVLAEERLGHPAGTKLWRFAGYDYGLAADDTAITGEPHKSWSLAQGGGTPTITVPDRIAIAPSNVPAQHDAEGEA